MSVVDDLQRLSSAEEFFEFLDVDYNPSVLHVARLHILRRMGEYLQRGDSQNPSDAEFFIACKSFLTDAYNDFLHSSPIDQRVFKVLKDAVKPKTSAPLPFVPLTTLDSSFGS